MTFESFKEFLGFWKEPQPRDTQKVLDSNFDQEALSSTDNHPTNKNILADIEKNNEREIANKRAELIRLQHPTPVNQSEALAA